MNATNLKQKSLKIKGLMVTAGLTPMEIASALRVDRRAVSQCTSINPKTGDFVLKNPYIREGIARYLGRSYQSVWGEKICKVYPKTRRTSFLENSSLSA